jgi:DNA-binding CsgD family transcriptional regulator
VIKRNLTEHELIVLELSAGKTNKQLADELLLSEQSIKQILGRAYMKLSVPSKRDALALARRRGLLPCINV